MLKEFSWSKQRRLFQICFLTSNILIIGCYVTWTSLIDSKYSNPFTSLKFEKQEKLILLWNSPHRIEAAAFGTGRQAFLDADCPVADCSIVANSSTVWNQTIQSDFRFLEQFDAVLFSVHELWISSLPPRRYRRPTKQRFVLLTQESPQSMGYFKPGAFDNFFNWTMSYRRDSDVQLLYGRIKPLSNANSTRSQQTENGLVPQRHYNKTKKVAWMVSHCKTFSKREEYVDKLKEFIPVDIYGRCGNLTCKRNASHWLSDPSCYVQLAKEYKFYLSFENSLCQDYVTEKFFSILEYDLVPIVMGGADYESIAPPNSYIDTARFQSPSELADYLWYLDSNNEEYEKYFDWKRLYSVEAGVEQMSRHAFCDLCAKLHQPEEEASKVYTSLVSQWSAKTQCVNP